MILPWLYSGLLTLIASFRTSEPLDIGVLMAVAFFIVSVLTSWRNPYNLGFRFIIQWECAKIIVRYLGSYVTYGTSLREGPWPIIWDACAVLGIYLIWRKRGHR